MLTISEQLKTIILTLLILLSFVFTFLLWYHVYFFEGTQKDYINFAQREKNLQTSKIICPAFIVLHKKQNTDKMFLHKSKEYTKVLDFIQTLKITSLPYNTDLNYWSYLHDNFLGIEFRYIYNMPFSIFLPLFKEQTINFSKIPKSFLINNFWLYFDNAKNEWILLLPSFKEKKIICLKLKSNNIQSIENLTQQNLIALDVKPIPLKEYLPWEKKNNNFYFNPYSYTFLKNPPFSTKRYFVKKLNIDNLKQTLFQGSESKPITLNKNETIFLGDNQIINYNKNQEFLTFSNTDIEDEKDLNNNEEENKDIELEKITIFIQKHKGWTRDYILEKYNKEEKIYTFRQINTLPIFWVKDSKIPVINLQIEKGEIIKYTRSLYYLGEELGKNNSSKLIPLETLISKLKRGGNKSLELKNAIPCFKAIEETKNNKKIATLVVSWLFVTNKKAFCLN